MVSACIFDSKKKRAWTSVSRPGSAQCPKIYCSFNLKNSVFQNEIALWHNIRPSSIEHKPKLISSSSRTMQLLNVIKCRLIQAGVARSLKFYNEVNIRSLGIAVNQATKNLFALILVQFVLPRDRTLCHSSAWSAFQM